MQYNHLKSWLILILLSIIWGSSFILMKVGLLSFTPLQAASLRIAISGIVLLPFMIGYAKGTSKSVWGWCILLGVVGNLIPFMSFALAQSVINSSLAGMLNSLQPLFTLCIGILVFKQNLPRKQIIGVLIGFAGAAILLGAKSSVASFAENFQFSLLVVLATFCYGISANIIRHYLHNVEPLKITSLSLGILIIPSIGLLSLSDFTLHIQTEEQVFNSLFAIGGLAIFGTAFAIILFNQLIKSSGMMMASSVAYLIPVVAIFWGLLDGELINQSHIIGISVIFSGLYLINNRKTPTA